MEKLINAAFQGGGVVGTAHIGAAAELEKAGYKFKRVAGTSAGAIMAALLASGFSCEEIKNEIISLDFKHFVQPLQGGGVPLLSDLFALNKYYGIYNTSAFERWLEAFLKTKNIFTFKNLKLEDGSYKVKIIASDLTNKKMIILPEDLKSYGLNPDSFSVAKVVVMSISIPLLFKPYKLTDSSGKESLIVDGGLYCNYPIWAFKEDSAAKTVGFKFEKSQEAETGRLNIIAYIKLVVNAMLASPFLGESKEENEILISTEVNGKNIRATDFDISKEEKKQLYENGAKAAKKFLFLAE